MRPVPDLVTVAEEADPDPNVEPDFAEVSAVSVAPSGWRPSLNAYRCGNEVIVYVDLAGVVPESVEVEVRGNHLIIRGIRVAPEPLEARSGAAQLLALEIDDGTFERVLALPLSLSLSTVATEYRDGLFRVAVGLKD